MPENHSLLLLLDSRHDDAYQACIINVFFSSIAYVSQDSENALEFSSTKNCPCVCASVHFSGGVACTFASLSLYCSVPPPFFSGSTLCFPGRNQPTVVKRNLFSAESSLCEAGEERRRNRWWTCYASASRSEARTRVCVCVCISALTTENGKRMRMRRTI